MRLRLTLLYVGLFLASAACLLVITYFLVARQLPGTVTLRTSGGGTAGTSGQVVTGGNGAGTGACAPSADGTLPTVAQLNDCVQQAAAGLRNDTLDQLLIESGVALDRAMLKQGSGAIVNTSSVAGLVGFQGLPAYEASKHGVAGLTKTAALEYAKSGIRVNAVCPGVINTPMVERLFSGQPHWGEAVQALEPVARMGKPEEIAEAVVWLCSDAASFVTGLAMAVDGGMVAQ